MKKRILVNGAAIAAPRPTRAVAMLLASALSVPVFIALSLVEWLMF